MSGKVKAQNWNELKEVLADRDIDMKFKVSRKDLLTQGLFKGNETQHQSRGSF